MKYWLTVYSKPRQEATAEEHLRRQGFTVYFPRIQTARRQKDRWQDRIEPLFPRYLFLQAEQDTQSLAPVRSTQGVSKLVRFGDELVPVPDALIAALKEMADPESGLHVPAAQPFQPGDRVSVLEGPFAELQGIYQCEQGEQRALILLECLGKLTSVSIAHHKIVRQP